MVLELVIDYDWALTYPTVASSSRRRQSMLALAVYSAPGEHSKTSTETRRS